MWIGLVTLLVLAAVYGILESRWIRPVTYQVAIANLPQEFNGLSILHLSDLHGRVEIFSHRTFRQWADEADMIAVTGDLYQPGLGRTRLAAELDRLRQDHTAFLVSGNHDYHHGHLFMDPLPTDRWLIDNQGIALIRGEARLWIAGLPDLVLGAPDWTKMLSQIGEGPAILLSHRPDAAIRPEAKRFQLVLSGHTHGGQIVFPLVGALLKHNHVGGGYVAGRHQVEQGPVLITSRGLGTSELPMRFLCRPELVRVVLRSADANPKAVPVDLGQPEV